MWRKWLGRQEAGGGEQHPPRDVAMAVLLLECARADFEQDEAESAEIQKALVEQLGLSAEQVTELVGMAGETRDSAVSMHGPVSRLNDELSADEKRSLIAWMWRVAHADGRIDPYEEHLLRQVADLLFIPHADFIKAKLEASGER